VENKCHKHVVIKKIFNCYLQGSNDDFKYDTGLPCILPDAYQLSQYRCFVYILQNGPKNVALYFCPYLCQLLINFQNSFTGALHKQFAIMIITYPTRP